MTRFRLYRTETRHTRFTPFRYALRQRGHLWLVDAADPPRLPRPFRWLAEFRSTDHCGDPKASIDANVRSYCAAEGVDLHGGTVLMLTQPRMWGYVFNPLTVYWCRDETDATRYVIAEVHNTYGQRHRYLLRVDEKGRAAVDKEFYVSPFLPISGTYRMAFADPGDRLSLAITLYRSGRPLMSATVTGRGRSAGLARMAVTALLHPLATVMVSAAIRWHGVRLYLRGLPIVPRTVQHSTNHKG
ncbi:DUF1365 domain-containing protein [Stackebrandtia soli]|uniref:DUF1365 domain-containing protein n=1 Tax=Stackebrandtia soli TaxID=1892856 RepID=UPI0039E7B597